MPRIVEAPTLFEAAGNPAKTIEEHVGLVTTGTSTLSIAHMRSPSGWSEQGQMPDFDEHTLVLAGSLRVEHEGGVIDVAVGQTVIDEAGEWVRYSSPGPEGAEHIAVCIPAYSPETVHRDGSGSPGGAS